MTRDVKFEEAFWDADYTGSTGYEVLVKKVKDGQKMLKDTAEFFRQRAKAEEDYAKSLQKVAQFKGGSTESGTMKVSWEELRVQTERVGQEHAEASRFYYEQAARTQSFSDKQKQTRKSHEEVVKASIKKKQDQHKQVLEAKRLYQQRCRDSENQDNMIQTHKMSGHLYALKEKEREGMIIKQVKLQTDAHKADQQYRDAITSLEETRSRWQQEMIVLCKVFERLEEVRLEFLRNEFWVSTNISSQTAIDVDLRNEEVRQSLEKCSIDTDITHFVREKRVGGQCPGKIEYEPYHSVHTGRMRPIGGEESARPTQAAAEQPRTLGPNITRVMVGGGAASLPRPGPHLPRR